ncbi:hypothetical protein PMAYCL1PPCAC_11206, partial [Pristionchus mayeri]
FIRPCFDLPMDLLALPESFLLKLMRIMARKDRNRLRQTSRNFEKLVAESDAGHFDYCKITYYDFPREKSSEPVLIIHIDEETFSEIEITNDGLKRFLEFSSRIFKTISMNEVRLELADYIFPLDFLRQFLSKFDVELLSFVTYSDIQLEKSRSIIVNFPKSKYSLRTYFHPEYERILSLPPMEDLKILSAHPENLPMTSESFLK